MIKPLTDKLSTNAWKNRRAFIIAGGPSLTNFDFTPLKNELTIGVNKAYQKFPVDINFSLDKSFIHKAAKDPLWKNYNGYKVSRHQTVKTYPFNDLYFVKSLEQSALSFDLNKGVFFGNNSGFGAMMLAIALRANPIYLLGVDLSTADGKTHWHNGYGQEANVVNRAYDRFKSCFERFADIIKEHGVEVYNLNPKSALKCFPFMTLEEVLERDRQ